MKLLQTFRPSLCFLNAEEEEKEVIDRFLGRNS